MKIDIFVIVLQKIKISVTKILSFLYQADLKSQPFSFVRIEDISNKGESYMLRIKFIAKEAPNYSKGCWVP